MKIVVLDGYTENPGDLSWAGLEALGEVTVYDRTAYQESPLIAERIGDAEIVVMNKTPISKETIDKCPNIKLIAVLATGYNVVDYNYAKEKGIPVCNVPTYGTASVSQFAIALLLEVCHHVGAHSESVHAGEWASNADWCYWNYPLIELEGKTFGLCGCGKIGDHTGAIAKALGMNVLAYDLYPNDTGRAIAEYVTLDELYARADIVSLHCPLTDRTRYMIGDAAISRMKPGVILINTGRGQLIHTEALIDGLKEKKIGAAGLDVYEEEAGYFYEDTSDRIMDDDVLARLLSFNNVIVTSHQGFFTREAVDNIARTTMQNIKDFSECRRLENEVRAEPENAVGQL